MALNRVLASRSYTPQRPVLGRLSRSGAGLHRPEASRPREKLQPLLQQPHAFLIAHEFDYKGENQIVYEENGVTIRSWPAIHAGDGPVSFALYWNGYKVVFGGDTFPNTWFIKYAKDADIVIHEAMLTAEQLRKYYNQPPPRTIMMVWNLTRDGVTERMAVSTGEAWDVPSTEKGLEPDKSRKPEIVWPELINQRLDMTDVNKGWLDEYKKEHGLK